MIDKSIFLVRLANSADFGAVSALLVASYSSLLAAHYDENTLNRALPILTKANPTLLASGTYYVAEDKLGNLVGCGGWTAAQPGSKEVIAGEAHIRHFATHPQCLRRGVGKTLLTRCFSDACLLGIRMLYCVSSLNAQGFYRALGFDTVGPFDLVLGASLTIPGVLMSRELA
jgi:N-acetylglutamate synthase-like GNAT family acetyltransferase